MTPPESTVWECHGTGTSLGDPIEVGAVRKVQIRQQRPEPLMISTSKSNQGHLEGGAAMASMVKCVLECRHTKCVSSLHLRQLNPHLESAAFDAFYSSECSPFKYPQGHCQVSSLGFGGSNGHAIFWGKNITEAPDIKSQFMRRLRKMGPPEVRPVGDSPDEWETCMPDDPNGNYYIVLDPSDAPNAPIRWVKEEASDQPVIEDDDEDIFFCVTGNFNGWTDDRMEAGEVDGQFMTTVEVPSDGQVQFRFLQEGDAEKIVAPVEAYCTRKALPMEGPDAGLTNFWVVKAEPGTEVQIELFQKKGMRSVTWFKR